MSVHYRLLIGASSACSDSQAVEHIAVFVTGIEFAAPAPREAGWQKIRTTRWARRAAFGRKMQPVRIGYRDSACEIHAELHFGRMEQVATRGIPNKLERFLARLADLGKRIACDFLVPPAEI